MNVASIRYQPVEGGAFGGHFALHVTLGAADAPSVTSTELTTRIHDCFEALALKSKIKGVLIDCREAVGSAEEMQSLLSTLKDWGLVVHLWVGESTRYAWFDPSQYIVVFVKSQHWPNFRVNEIRYVMPEGDWVEPDVYDVNAGAVCYIIPSEGAKGGSLISFITECKRPWGIIKDRIAIDFKVSE